MAFLQSKYATADMDKPSPWYFCDRCGFRRMKSNSAFQFDWRGNAIQDLRILVCTETCLDVPQPQLRPILVGPDPVPIRDPRPGWQSTQQGTTPVFSVLELVDDDVVTVPPGNPPTPTPAYYLQDGYGNFITDGSGNPVTATVYTGPGPSDDVSPPSPPEPVQLFDTGGNLLFDTGGNPLFGT